MFGAMWRWLWFGGAGDGVLATPTTLGGLYKRAFWRWQRIWRWTVAGAVKTLTKPESEDRDFGFDFSDSPEIQGGETVASATIPVPPSGLTFGTVRVDEDFDDID